MQVNRRARRRSSFARCARGAASDDYRDLALPDAGAILFTTGVFGIFLNRKNVIIIMMSIELILLAVNINFVAFSAYLNDLAGPDLRHVRPHRRGRRGGDRARDRRGLLPQSRQHRGRRHQPDEGLRRGHAADHPRLLAGPGRPDRRACSGACIGDRARAARHLRPDGGRPRCAPGSTCSPTSASRPCTRRADAAGSSVGSFDAAGRCASIPCRPS